MAPSGPGEIDENSYYISSSHLLDEESDSQEQITLSILDKLKTSMPLDSHRK